MPKWLKLLLSPLWLPLLVVSLQGIAGLAQSAPPPGRRELIFVGGLLLYFIVVLLAKERGRSFAHTFEHELTHLVVGLFFLKSPSGFKVGKNEGETYLTGSNFVISLAPYFLPLWGMIPLLLMPLLNPTGELAALGALGFLYGLHLYSTLHEFGFYQTDVKEHGRIFSVCCVLALNALLLGIVTAAILGGWPAIGDYFRACYEAARWDWNWLLTR